VRFSARLGFEIEPATREAIGRLAPQITVVSQERIKAELEMILTCAAGVQGISEMHSLGLLRPILPEAEAMAHVQLATETLLDHALAVLDRLSEPSFELALAGLLHCCAGADEQEVVQESARLVSVAARRLKCSNSERTAAAWLVLNQFALQDAKERRLSYLKRLFAHGEFEKLLALFKAKTAVGCADSRDFEFVSKLVSRLSPDEIRPEPLLSGTDLIEMGLKPSELFSVVIDGVYDAQLEGEIADRQAAIELALKIARES
jgi:poly(A) polymerase